ncbi:hypothetical protein AB0451_39430 [Streptomyces sp. NPDC052000]|uniref:hypothetical protein n=1 Tax=Streptomyces sp. NPDC052000 TaxID=3155676 RepID=UPI00344C4007
MKNITEVIILIVYLAIVFTMVRPRSQGPTLVKNTGDALSNLIKSATGGGTF